MLAISHLLVLPSAFGYGVGTLIFENYAAQYPTRMCPYQCFTSSLATGHAHDSGPVWVAGPSPYGSFIRTSTPVYPGAQLPVLDSTDPRPNRECRVTDG